jgi:hypothetical protein
VYDEVEWTVPSFTGQDKLKTESDGSVYSLIGGKWAKCGWDMQLIEQNISLYQHIWNAYAKAVDENKNKHPVDIY